MCGLTTALLMASFCVHQCFPDPWTSVLVGKVCCQPQSHPNAPEPCTCGLLHIHVHAHPHTCMHTPARTRTHMHRYARKCPTEYSKRNQMHIHTCEAAHVMPGRHVVHWAGAVDELQAEGLKTHSDIEMCLCGCEFAMFLSLYLAWFCVHWCFVNPRTFK